MPKVSIKEVKDSKDIAKRVRKPTPINAKQFQHILTYISRGLTIRDALKEMKLNGSAWDNYIRTVGEAQRRELTQAKEMQADALGERVLELMDDVVNKRLNPHEGRVAMDGAKWLASKYKPRIYSDHVHHELNVKIDIGAIIIDARNRLKHAEMVENEGGPIIEALEGHGDPKEG